MAPITLTVEQMVDLASGTREEGKPNALILKRILQILTKKLNLGQEEVELEVPGIDNLESLVKNQKDLINVNACNFDPYDHNKSSAARNERVGNETRDECDVNSRITVLENMLQISNDRMAQLQCELHEIRKTQDETHRLRNVKIFEEVMDECNKCRCEESNPNIPFCVDYSDPFNELVLGLLSNKNFLIELMKKISCPVLDKVSNWENQLQILGDLFQNFAKRAEEEFEREPTTETNAEAICKLKEEFNEFRKDFLLVVEEIQDMLDAKLDKFHLPPLKKYITTEFTAIHEELENLRKYDDCPDAVGTTRPVFDNLTCLSCTGKVCQRSKPRKSSVFRKAKENTILKEKSTSHINKHLPTRNCGGSYTVTAPQERIFRKKNLADEFGVEVIQAEVRYLQGIDGNMYRAEPEIVKCTCDTPKEKEGEQYVEEAQAIQVPPKMPFCTI